MAAQIENGGVAGYQYWRLLPGNSTADSVNCMLLLFHLTCIRALAKKTLALSLAVRVLFMCVLRHAARVFLFW